MPSTFEHGYAVLIGIGNHVIAPGLSLPTTVNDVEALRRTLVSPDLCGYPNNDEHLRILTNEFATNENIVDRLNWLKGKANEDADATAVVYFSGHGYVTPDNAYYLITQNAVPGLVADTALSSDRFSQLVRDVKASRVLIVMDCCHAQGMAQAKAVDSLDEETTKGLEGSDSAITSLIDKLAQGQGRAVFCSSRGNEKSYLMKDGSLSVYTYHFIEALQGAGHSAGDPFVTIASLMNHVGKAVPETSRKLYGTSQQPFQSIEGTNFPIALICGGKGMPRGGWESLQDEAQRYLKGLVGAIARDMLVGGYLSADDVVQILGTAPGQAASCCRPK